MAMLTESGTVHDPHFGAVKVVVRTNARRITGRIDGGSLKVSVPYGMPVGDLLDIISRWSDRLPVPGHTAATQPFYRTGQTIVFDHFRVSISLQANRPESIMILLSRAEPYIGVGSRVDMALPQAWRAITRAIERIAGTLAPRYLLDEARDTAQRLGIQPIGWRIGRGHRVLGTCSASGVVTLSRSLMFMPADLRQYVICHELAHLSELNHSARFHALCDSYLDGREKQLRTKLKNFKWPVFY